MHKCGIRVGVVTIDVPERERGIDIKDENATVARFLMSMFTTPTRNAWFYVKVCNCRRFSNGVMDTDFENHATVTFLCSKSMPRSRSGTSTFTTPTRIPWF